MNSNRAANPMSGSSPWVNSRRADRQAPRVRELDLNSLPYVPLPRAPLRWGTPSARAHSQMQEAEALFEIRDAPWQLASIEKLVAYERPDPAFRLLTFMLFQHGSEVTGTYHAPISSLLQKVGKHAGLDGG